MSLMHVNSFVTGDWIAPDSAGRPIESAITGEIIGQAGNQTLPYSDMLEFARNTGGPALRDMTFHDRARLLKALASHLNTHKQELYDLSFQTGATQKDHLIDIDGGIGTMFVFASKGRREMPDTQVYLDGDLEQLSREGSFMGQHICTPLLGVAVHINAFNFPVWGMLEKLAPTLLAGMPAIVKPATSSCYVTQACVAIMLESGLLPKGALQLVSGGLGNTLDLLGVQDVVSFTGSARTALTLRSNPNILEKNIRFTAEQDSLNASVLGPDATPDTPEFDLFVKEVVREMTTKAGQKCTAIRRIMVPDNRIEETIDAITSKLDGIRIGDPRDKDTQMGALISSAQKRDVLTTIEQFQEEADCVLGDPSSFELENTDLKTGAFLPPMLFHAADPDRAATIHEQEAFGPVSTIMGYKDLKHGLDLVNQGQGSLVASIITRDGDIAREATARAAPWHGRLYFNNRDSMKESTGHGSPLPHMVHGGPGRAGGGEELGGIRGVMHYLQRTAIQGSPDILTAIGTKWVPGAQEIKGPVHPFQRSFAELEIGETLHTKTREVTLDDVEHFADFTGDRFYAHMDEDAARANPFFPGRVAHGYLLLSFAAGLFVEPNPGPVLANTGLERLRFLKPLVPGETLKVRLTVKQKTKRNETYGEVRWHVSLTDAASDLLAEYELLTMVAY